MATHTITDDVLLSPEAEAYFTRADRRVRNGVRAALAMLGLPFPDYARRKLPGFPAAQAVTAAFRADNPHALPPTPGKFKARIPNLPRNTYTPA